MERRMGMALRLVLSLLAAVFLCSSVLGPGPTARVSATLWSPQQEPVTYLVAGTSRAVSKKRSHSQKPATLIRDVRMRDYRGHTRVVLDLDRPVAFTQTRRKNPDRVIIEIENSTFAQPAKTKLAEEGFPPEVEVSQTRQKVVKVYLDLEKLDTYKFFPLSNPPRLVLDLFRDPTLNGAVAPQPGLPGPDGATPSQPRIPPPVRTEIKTIVIDPGHGGKDPGAVGRRGTREKDITLKVSRHLRDLLIKRLGKKVLMTRERDVFVDLEERADFANKHSADLFVSIHVNSHPKRSVKGLEVYHFGEASDRRALEVAARENGIDLEGGSVGWEFLVADLLTTKMVEDSLEFAWTARKEMVGYMKRQYKVDDHGVKTAPFYVLRFTTMPSILTEIGFVSNSTEEKRMRGKTYQRHAAQAIFQGIAAYIDTVNAAGL